MKPWFVFVSAVFFAVLITPLAAAQGNVYYVDVSGGDDNNDGKSWASAWQTFQRALPNWGGGGDVVQQGDTVYVASGDYGAVNYYENGDTGRTDWITYVGDSNKNSIIRQLQIRYTVNVYMKFYNFSIYEAADPNDFDRSLEIYGTDDTTNRASKIEFYGCYIRARAVPVKTGLRAIYIRYADDIVLEDCEIDGGNAGLFVVSSATNLIFTNCHFHDQWNDIVDLYGTEDGTSIDNVIFDGCFFEDLIWLDGLSEPEAHMDYYQSSGNNNAGNAVNDVIFRNNTFKFTWNPDWENEGLLLYVGIQPQAHGTGFTFENNLLYGTCRAAGFKFSIKVADTVKDNVIIRSNTFGATSTEGYSNILTSKLTGVQHHNNIYHTGFQITTAPEEVTQGNNIYNSYGNVGEGGKIGPTMDSSSIILGQAGVEELFVNFAGGDFRPIMDKAACNGSVNPKGVAVGALPCVEAPPAENIPLYSTFNGSTTNFSSVPDINAVFNAILEKTSHGKINFSGQTLNFSSLDLDGYVTIGNNLIGFDTAILPGLNVPAILSIYGSFNDSVILEDGAECYITGGSHCNITEHAANRVTFTVDHFSYFNVGVTGTAATGGAPGFELNLLTALLAVLLIGCVSAYGLLKKK